MKAKAIYWIKTGKPQSAFEIREHDVKEPSAGEIRIQVEYSGLNFADVMARLGYYPEAPKMPSVLGYEVVGVIESIGPDVTHLKAGDRVVAMTRFGGYASHVVTGALGAAVIPANLDGAQATALATQYGTAYYAAYEMVRLHPGDHVLIQAAAGGVGTALVQMCKLQGCMVYGTTGSRSKVPYLRELGVDHPIVASEVDFASEALRLSGGRKMDVIFDSLGGRAVKQGWKILGAGGRILCFGAADLAQGKKNIFKAAGTLAGFGIYHPLSFMTNSKGIIGINMLKIVDTRPDILQRCLKEIVKLVEDGKLRPQVGKVFPYTEIAAAHEFLESRKSTGKIAIRWT